MRGDVRRQRSTYEPHIHSRRSLESGHRRRGSLRSADGTRPAIGTRRSSSKPASQRHARSTARRPVSLQRSRRGHSNRGRQRGAAHHLGGLLEPARTDGGGSRLPDLGNVIPSTGGLRKVRWSHAGRGKGKRGGTRVIYYWHQPGEAVYLLVAYSKDQRDDLSARQKKVLRQLVEEEFK